VGEGFVCEAVWPEKFDDGGFDRQAVVAGTGVRLRDGEAVFVSSTSTVDRLHSVERPEGPVVSNSLACLVSAIGAQARLDHGGYLREMSSITKGIDDYDRTIPTTSEQVRLTYFRNLVWDGSRLTERDKPPEPEHLRDFAEYRDFVRSVLARLTENMSSGARRHPLRWLGTLSSGYDSATATTLGTEVGCDQAICFDRSRLNQPDSGEPIARALGIEPLVIERATWRRRAARFDRTPEVPFLAAMPTGELAPFAAAREHLSGRVLLTGFQGGAMWRLWAEDPSPRIARKDSSGLGFAEFRLVAGFINCAPAFWTALSVDRLAAIGRSEEMRPWVIGKRYQKPVARRIVEDAGVPRDLFGRENQPGVGGSLTKEPEFLGPESLADYQPWIRREAAAMGARWLVTVAVLDLVGRAAAPAVGLLATVVRRVDGIARRPSTHILRRRVERVESIVRPLAGGAAIRMFVFQWGLARQAERYRAPAEAATRARDSSRASSS